MRICVVGMSLLLAGTATAQPLPRGFQKHSDLEYAKAGDKPLLLDVYAPEKSDRPLPLVVWVHGGAWMHGSKNRCPALRLLRQGYVVASINYRLTNVAIFPAQIQDCKAAIRWLRANAKKFHIDSKRVGAWGSSAGGHLVALLGTSGGVKAFETAGKHQDQSSEVQAVVDFFGPTDFLQMDAHALPGSKLIHDAPRSPESRLIGGPIQKNKTKAAKANPITYVDKSDPPFLIVHGDKDPLVPLHQSEILAKAMKKAGVPVKLHVVQGAGHGFRSKDLDRLVDQHFARHLQGKK